MCRLKAIASSVKRLLRYANCSGSLMSFSKHLLKMGVRATGLQSFKHVILFFFGMGTMVDFLKHEEGNAFEACICNKGFEKV